MRKNGIHVSDHAVIRYLERAHGIDIEAVRDEIGALCERGVKAGASGVLVASLEFLLQDGHVVTVLPVCQPDIRTGRVRPRRRREIDE